MSARSCERIITRDLDQAGEERVGRFARWQADRGQMRSALYDQKDREFAQLLFVHRGKGMGVTFLNRRLIPLAIHKNTQTIKKYARRNPIHLHRRVARADTLSTVIEGLYDPSAAAQSKPSVRWFLGYDADGAPQFCGLPAHHTCPHRMDCSRCGLFIGGGQARLVHDDPTLLRVTAEVAMADVQRLLNDGQREAAARALAAAKEVPAPVPPSVAFLTNPAGLSDARLKELADLATEDALAQLRLVADDLIATLAEHRSKDGRNVAVTALRKRLAFVQGLIQRRNVQLDGPDAATLGPGSGTHPI